LSWAYGKKGKKEDRNNYMSSHRTDKTESSINEKRKEIIKSRGHTYNHIRE
jgi:hypothetical protein